MQTLEVSQELRIDTIELRKATMVLRAINHPLRQQMLKIIHQAGAMTVTELYVKLRLEQAQTHYREHCRSTPPREVVKGLLLNPKREPEGIIHRNIS